MAVQSGYLNRLSLGQLGVPRSREAKGSELATTYREQRRSASLPLISDLP